MSGSAGLLLRLTRYRVDYSRRSYSLDVADIETVLAMGRELTNAKDALEHAVLALKEAIAERALLTRAVCAAESVFAEAPVRAVAACYVAFQIFEDAVRESRTAAKSDTTGEP